MIPGGGHMGRMDLKKLALVCALGFLAAGCASADNQEAAAADDPLEPMNRTFFDLNQRIDRPAGGDLLQRHGAAAGAPRGA